jgi:probable addiction module antidote protein
MAEHYREYPEDALALLSSVLEDDDAMPGELLIVLRQMAKAFGGVPAIAEKAALNPTQLYRTLSAEGNPSLSSLTAILKAMGMRLAVKRIEAVDQPADAVRPKTRVRAGNGEKGNERTTAREERKGREGSAKVAGGVRRSLRGNSDSLRG